MEETTLSGRLPYDNSFPTEKDFSTKLVRKEHVLEVLTYFFILLFTYAGLRKLVDLNMFVKEVWCLAVFGSKFAIKWQFLILSCGELLVALLLILPRTRLIGWYSTFFLMVTINGLMFFMQQFAKVIPLYYGGIFPFISFIIQFTINIVILFFALIGLFAYLDYKK
jgi:hypothetical protein